MNLFIAVKGTSSDGHRYITEAHRSGAVAVVCSEIPDDRPEGLSIILVKETQLIAGWLAANFYDHPSQKINLVGITGTNGKTSFVQLSHALFTSLGYQCGMLSTIENKIGDQVLPSALTTPDPVGLQKLLHLMVEGGCSYVFMEVSSHALHQHRTAGCRFVLAVFSNITHDHLDYHGTFDAYLQAKKMFFDQLDKNAYALINLDDRHSGFMVQNCQARVYNFALKKSAIFKGRIMENSAEGLLMQIDQREVFCRLVGQFNAYNLLATYGTASILLGDKEQVLQHLSLLKPPPGRMELIFDPVKNLFVFVDYAHTPDALKNVLETIRHIRRSDQKTITVVGCGGNRDKSKRPIMAATAAKLSDRVILTSDNPRMENPEQIIRDMEEGLSAQDRPRVLSLVNRKEAIRTACMMADPGSIILIAGKGHENYQDIQGVKHPFDDREIVRDFVNQFS